MTLETLDRANELVQKAKRLNEQLQHILCSKNSGGPIEIYDGLNSSHGVLLTDLPGEARDAVFAVIVNALETELARTANELAEM